MPRTQQRRRTMVASFYAVLGIGALLYAYTQSTAVPDDPSYRLMWVVFAVTALVLSLRSVEVNDRLLVSASVMVVFTAGVFLVARPLADGHRVSAALPVALMTTVGFLSPGDIKHRQYSRALSNFGQLAAAGLAAGLVLDTVLTGRVATLLGLWQVDTLETSGSIQPRWLGAVILAAVLGAAAYTLVNFIFVRLAVQVIYRDKSLVPWSHLGSLFVLQITQCAIGGMLGLVLAMAPSLSLVPLVLIVFVIGHLGYAAQAGWRTGHEDMLRGFVKILEARDLYTRGHTERVAMFVLAVGAELGFSGNQLARMRWAALIHDVGKLAVPTPIMRKQAALTPEEYLEMRIATHKVDDLLSEVDVLAPMVVICSGAHPRWHGEDLGQRGHSHTSDCTREQSVLAVADAFDAMTNTRAYRMAMSQSAALAVLVGAEEPLFQPDVVEALSRALAKNPESYGPREEAPLMVAARARAIRG